MVKSFDSFMLGRTITYQLHRLFSEMPEYDYFRGRLYMKMPLPSFYQNALILPFFARRPILYCLVCHEAS